MSPEQLLLAALSTVSGCLCFLFRIIWARSMECEKWRAEKEPIILAMAKSLGLAQGAAEMVNSCHIKACPFAGKLDPTYSIEANKEQRKPKL
jgi:hypothetical protein